MQTTVEMIKVVKKEIKISTIKIILTKGYTNFNQERNKPLFELGLKLIRENRYEIFSTYEGYQIITNGYHALKEVHFPNNPNLQSIEGKEVINKLITILEKEK